MGAREGSNTKLIAFGVIVIIIAAFGTGYALMQPPATLRNSIVMGTTDSVESSLDPAGAYDYFGWEIILSLGSGLVEYRAGATGAATDIVPALATTWSGSSDGLVWTFNLRTGVRFDDGREFQATDVKYTFDRGMGIADPEGPFVGIGYGDVIDHVTVDSKYVVSFHLKIPFAAFLSLMAATCSYIVDSANAPMSVVQYHAADARASHPMGLGPYRLTTWSRVGGKDYSMRLDANPFYWNASAGYPKTKEIFIRFFSDATALALAIRSSEVDVAFRHVDATTINYLKTLSSVHVWQGTGAFIQYLVFQTNSTPFINVPIRRAVSACINRTNIVNTVFLGQSNELYSMIPSGMSYHEDSFAALGNPNYTLAATILAAAGYNSANKLTFDLWYESSGHYPQSADLALVLKDSIEKSGLITINLKSADWPSYRQHRIAEDMQAYILGWYPDYIDADDYIYPFYDSAGGSWIHDNYANPVMDQLIAWARGNTSTSARDSLYGQIQDLALTDCPMVPIYQSSAFAVTKTNVYGVYLDITQNWRHWLVYATA